MINTDISAQAARDALVYDPTTGAFVWRIARGQAKVGFIAGCKLSDGYWCITLHGKQRMAHRLAWLHFHGAWPVGQIDHINGIRSDNRIKNLRDVTPGINRQNMRRARSNNSTGLLGVSFDRGRFRALIQVAGVQKHLGCFDTAELAHAAYVYAKRTYHPGGIL